MISIVLNNDNDNENNNNNWDVFSIFTVKKKKKKEEGCFRNVERLLLLNRNSILNATYKCILRRGKISKHPLNFEKVTKTLPQLLF